jgi:hypothetical protein
MNDPNSTSVREPYEPPTIEDVPVRAEEAMPGACKATTLAGPAQASCQIAPPCSGFSFS